MKIGRTLASIALSAGMLVGFSGVTADAAPTPSVVQVADTYW